MTETLQDYEYRQTEDCAFYYVNGEYGWYHEPIDDHAIYGWPTLGNRNDGDFDIPHRNYSRSLPTVIRTVQPGDRVRVNDGNWMEVVTPENGFVDEGFAARYENGSVLYAIRAHDMGQTGPPENRMRRFDDYSSEGIVHCLEIEWNPDGHLRYD